MKLEIINEDFSICKVNKLTEELLSDEFLFVGKTDEELSVVCRTKNILKDCIEKEEGWAAFRFVGTLDFSLTGILAPVATILAGEQIGIFAVSTFNTDYILVKKKNLERAVIALEKAGYEFIR